MSDLTIVEDDISIVVDADGHLSVVTVPAEVTVEISEVGVQGAAGPSHYPFPFSFTEDIFPLVGKSAVIIEHTGYAVEGVRAYVDEAPTGGPVEIDVNIGGVTIFTNQANRPTIAAGGQDSGFVTNMDVSILTPGDKLTVDVDLVGPTTPGAWLTVTVWARRVSG